MFICDNTSKNIVYEIADILSKGEISKCAEKYEKS